MLAPLASLTTADIDNLSYMRPEQLETALRQSPDVRILKIVPRKSTTGETFPQFHVTFLNDQKSGFFNPHGGMNKPGHSSAALIRSAFSPRKGLPRIHQPHGRLPA